MNPTLDTLNRRLTSATAGLTARQTQLRLNAQPNKWTIQQIVEHLLLTYAATSNAFETRLAKGTPTQAKPTPAQYAGQFAITRLGLFPSGRMAPAAVDPTTPTPALSGPSLATVTTEALARLDTLCDQAESLFGTRTRAINHMILGPLTIPQWRRFHLAHGTHHVKQILAIRKSHQI
jgi:hypothetical protein